MKFNNTKKAAMFGLDCRTLRKQFGELFLVSRHSEASKGASGSCGYTKRAAMFGLDARIALAIFGALSVISGAALYSAIQQAKVISQVVELKEIAKAVEQYMLDIGGDFMPYLNEVTTPTHLQTDELLRSSQTGWKGPYLPIDDLSEGNARNDLVRIITPGEEPANIIIYRASNNNWGGFYSVSTDFTDMPCNTPVICHTWVLSEWYESQSFIDAMDKYIDGKVDYGSGKLRVRQWDDRTPNMFTVYYYIAPTLKR